MTTYTFYEPLTADEFATVRHLLDRLICQQEDEGTPEARERCDLLADADAAISAIARLHELPTKFIVTSSRDAWSSPHIGIHACGCDHIDQRRREGFKIQPVHGAETWEAAYKSLLVEGLVDDFGLTSDDVAIMDCAL